MMVDTSRGLGDGKIGVRGDREEDMRSWDSTSLEMGGSLMFSGVSCFVVICCFA